jgi:cell division protein FtsN
MSQARSNNNKQQQGGGFVLGLIVGLLLGLAVALGVALYITKVPVPFINKVPQRTAEQDAAEAARNKNWDPNAPLAGKAGNRANSGIVGASAPAAVATPTAVLAPSASAAKPAAAPAPPAEAAKKPDARTAAASAAPAGADPYLYFIQAGAFTRAEDAEQQRAKLAMQGFSAKVMEREQSGRTVFRVRLGPLDSRDEAEGLQRKVEASGSEANLVRVQR